MEDLQGGTLALEHRYDVERREGEFGLVSMYRGTQHPFERPVWIKVCEAPHANSTPEVYERLKKSIVQAAEFEHDRVPAVADFGDIDKHLAFWIVERRDATALSDYLERHGTLAPEEALEIVCRVGEVIADAHAADMVHGGIAPRWIGVLDEGVVVDHFGIQPTMHEIRAMTDVIMSQDVLWSVPPEAFSDDEVPHSKAGDVWALGALLYWAVAGVHPYLDDPTDTSEAVIRLRAGAQPPSLEELGFELALASFVDRALAPDPEDRFPSVRAMLDAAPNREEPSGDKHVSPPEVSQPLVVPSTPQRSMGTAFAIAVALIVLSNLGWYFYTTKEAPQAETPNTAVTGPAILPVGVDLNTEPAGATVYRIDEGNEVEFGDVPLTLDPKALPAGELPLVIRKRGHRDLRLDVTADEDGHHLKVHLPTEGEQAAAQE